MKTCAIISAFTLASLAGTAFAQKGGSTLADALMAQANVAELLRLTTNNAQQQIEVTVGPVPGEVTVSGISGVPSSFVFTGIGMIELTTGNSFDFVEFRILTEVVPQITLNTRAGNSDVKFTYELNATPAAAASNVTVIGGTGNDKVAFNVESRAAGFAANWDVQHSAGNNETVVSLNAPEVSDSLSIALNSLSTSGQDKIEVSAIHNATFADLSLTGQMGGNSDTAVVVIDGLGASTTTQSLNLDLGAGNDAFESSVISRGGLASFTGSINGGDGLDALVFKAEADSTVNTQISGGNGNDLIDFALKGTIEGSPRLLGGAGNDELKLVVDGPAIATPFFDGGTGFDIAIGFGTFVNVEQIN